MPKGNSDLFEISEIIALRHSSVKRSTRELSTPKRKQIMWEVDGRALTGKHFPLTAHVLQNKEVK